MLIYKNKMPLRFLPSLDKNVNNMYKYNKETEGDRKKKKHSTIKDDQTARLFN